MHFRHDQLSSLCHELRHYAERSLMLDTLTGRSMEIVKRGGQSCMMCRCMLGSSSTTAGCGHGSRVLLRAELPSLFARMVALVSRSNIHFLVQVIGQLHRDQSRDQCSENDAGEPLVVGEKLWGWFTQLVFHMKGLLHPHVLHCHGCTSSGAGSIVSTTEYTHYAALISDHHQICELHAE